MKFQDVRGRWGRAGRVLLSAATDVGRRAVQPAPRCFVAPARNGESFWRGHALAGTNDDTLAFGVVRWGGGHIDTQGDQQTQSQDPAHHVFSDRAAVLSCECNLP